MIDQQKFFLYDKDFRHQNYGREIRLVTKNFIKVQVLVSWLEAKLRLKRLNFEQFSEQLNPKNMSTEA